METGMRTRFGVGDLEPVPGKGVCFSRKDTHGCKGWQQGYHVQQRAGIGEYFGMREYLTIRPDTTFSLLPYYFP